MAPYIITLLPLIFLSACSTLDFNPVAFNHSELTKKIPALGYSECSCTRDYLIAKERVTFLNATILCWQLGMEIASPMNYTEEYALLNVWRNTYPNSGAINGTWIGGERCYGCHSEFVWITSGKPVAYSDFLDGEPDNSDGNENCLQLILRDSTGIYGWNDYRCDALLEFACQTRCCC